MGFRDFPFTVNFSTSLTLTLLKYLKLDYEKIIFCHYYSFSPVDFV